MQSTLVCYHYHYHISTHQCNVFVLLCPAETELFNPTPRADKSSGSSDFLAAIARNIGDCICSFTFSSGNVFDFGTAVVGRMAVLPDTSLGGLCITASAEARTEENRPPAV